MTRDELKKKVNNLSCHLTYPILDDLHNIDAHDAEQRQVLEQQAQQIATLKSELSQRTNLEGSAPCWNSAHMKQIATLREALEGMLFIFGHHDGYAQVKLAQQALKEPKQ